MAIADRINEMYTHVGDIYDTLEVGGAQIYTLPNDFTQVDYLESNGTQYVDTGFKPNQDTRVVIDFIANQRSDAWLLGSRISYGDSNYSVLLWNGGDLRTDYNVGGQDMGASINTRYILDKNKNISTLYQNGTQVSQITATYSGFNPNHNMYLFACNNNGSVSAIANVKMFSCKIYDNGKLTRDFIPCYRNSDNVVGLYDIVEGNFYTNKGIGVFTYGSVSREHIDKNIININAQLKDRLIDYMNNGTEKIWNNWEKVTGSGTNISLSPTIEAPMKNVLNGNTYQSTTILPSEYTQVEYIESTGTQYIDTGVNADSKMSIDIDYQFTLQGTASYENCFGVINGSGQYLRYHFETRTADSLSFSYYHNNVINTYEGFYTDRVRTFVDMNNLKMQTWKNGTSQLDTNLQDFGDWDSELNFLLFRRNSNTTNLQYFSKNRIYHCKMYASGVLVRDFIPCYRNSDNVIGLYDYVNKVFYINQGTGAFTKGNNIITPTSEFPTPSPEYPQDVHVVSGDNYINVVGKNLFNIEGQYETGTGITLTKNDDGSYTLNGTANGNNFFRGISYLNEQHTISYKSNVANSNVIIRTRTGTPTAQTGIQDQLFVSSTSGNLTSSKQFDFVEISIPSGTTLNNFKIYIQLEKGNQVTDFQPYQSGSYEINLGKNLIPFSDIIRTGGTTSNGITFTLQADGTIKANGTATAGISIYLTTNYIEQKAGTYTFSDGIASGQSGTTFFLYADVRHLDETSWDTKNFSTAETTTRTRTIEEAFKFKPRIVIRQGQILNNLIFKPMLEEGTSATSFSPYFTPIELCKIGTYQDRIFKSSGKNLFNKDSISNGFLDESGIVGGDTSAYRTSDFIPILPNTAYYKTTTSSPRTKYYDKNKQPLNTTTYWDIPIGGNAGTFTTPSTAYYLRFSYPVAGINANDIMINKGSTALPYEPYGKAWYLNKQIGKVVLDGSESDWSYPSDNRFNLDNFANNYLKSDGNTTYISNYYKAFNQTTDNGSFNTLVNNQSYGFNLSATTSNYYTIRFKDTRYTSIADFKTWLSNNNLPVYYVLNTPTYTEITGTLAEQLETFYNAKSKNSQTNITQENNDLPFIIDVKALKNI